MQKGGYGGCGAEARPPLPSSARPFNLFIPFASNVAPVPPPPLCLMSETATRKEEKKAVEKRKEERMTPRAKEEDR